MMHVFWLTQSYLENEKYPRFIRLFSLFQSQTYFSGKKIFEQAT